MLRRRDVKASGESNRPEYVSAGVDDDFAARSMENLATLDHGPQHVCAIAGPLDVPVFVLT